MNRIDVIATQWDGGWELEISEDQHTQVTTLDRAHQQIIDYLDTTDEGVDHSGWDIRIIPDIPSWGMVNAAREATREASIAQIRAAELSRQVAQTLREEGFSVTDSAAIMGVSRGRISQLVRG